MSGMTQKRIEFLKAMLLEDYPNYWKIVDNSIEGEDPITKRILLNIRGREILISSIPDDGFVVDDSPLEVNKSELLAVINHYDGMGVEVNVDEEWVNALFEK